MKPIPVFCIAFLIVAIFLFMFPINLFDGEIVYQRGLQEVTEKAPLSLSYFIGMGYNEGDLDGIKSFRLLATGYLMAAVFLVGFPALIAYRIHLSRTKKSRKS